jgi:CDP-glycerol glycerophosphotransferase
LNSYKLKRILKSSLRVILEAVARPFKKKIVLYGTGFRSYTGLAKYQFLHDVGKRDAYWVAHSTAEARELRSKELPAVRKFSPSYWLVLIRTKRIFITHNVSDVVPTKLCFLEVHNLWHGVPLKKIGFDSNIEKKWLISKTEAGDRTPYEDWDVVYAQSEHQKDIFVRAFRIEEEKIRVEVPQAIRFVCEQRRRTESGKRSDGKLLLYLPTFRNDGSDESVILRTLRKIEQRFGSNVEKIAFKPHPLISMQGGLMEAVGKMNICSIPEKQDVFELLSTADILVTDYSSVAYDYQQASGEAVYVDWDDRRDYESKVGGLYDVKFEYILL